MIAPLAREKKRESPQMSTDMNKEVWVMNKAGNQLIQKGLPSVERQLFARAQISTMLLLRKEASRLAFLYEEMIGKEEVMDSFSGTSIRPLTFLAITS